MTYIQLLVQCLYSLWPSSDYENLSITLHKSVLLGHTFL